MTRLLNEERKTVAMLTKELATWRAQGLVGDAKENEENDENEGNEETTPPPPYDHIDRSSPTARRVRNNEEIAMLIAANAQLQQGGFTPQNNHSDIVNILFCFLLFLLHFFYFLR